MPNIAASYSALASWQDCPRRYYETRVSKRWPEPETAALREGKALHEAFAVALQLGSPLPPTYSVHAPLLQKVQSQIGVGTLMVEQKWALNIDLQPAPWFSDDAWLRTIADAVILQPPIASAIDWKTGKQSNQKDDLQLVLIALVMFAHFPDLKIIGARYIWLNEGKETERIVKRSEAPAEWQKILPRILEFQEAHVIKKFPPNPGRFCKNWCSVKSCEHNGR